MRSSLALSVAAMAGAVLAAPHYGAPVVENVHWVVETAYHTVYQTEGAQPTPVPEAPQYEAPAPAPAVPTKAPELPVPAPAPAPVVPSHKAPAQPAYSAPAAAPPAYSAPAAAPAPAPVASSAPTTGSGSGYMGIVSKWRKNLGLEPLAEDAKLASNAMDCVKSSPGEMKHKLNPGTYGQVLAPGHADDFEHVFVGGWLCEEPELPGLNGICKDQSKGWTYQGQTGHADILKDPSYTKIGCALFDGIWGCDLGY